MTAPTQQGIRSAGLPMTESIVRRLAQQDPPGMMYLENVPTIAHFVADSVTMDFVGDRHVPQMRLSGRVSTVVPEDPESMPYQLREIDLSTSGVGEPVMAEYDFTNEQLKMLIDKGLYTSGFAVPKEWTSFEYGIPYEADMLIIPPVEPGAPPIIGVNTAPLQTLLLTEANTGYDFADNLPNFSLEQPSAGTPVVERDDAVLEFDTGAELDGEAVSLEGIGVLDPNVVFTGDPEQARTTMEAVTGLHLTVGSQIAAAARETERAANARRAGLSRAGVEEPLAAAASLEELLERARERAESKDSLDTSLDAMEASLEGVDLDDLDLEGLDLSDLSTDSDADTDTDTGASADSDAESAGLEGISDEELESMDEAELAAKEGDSPAVAARKQALRTRLIMLRRMRADRVRRERERETTETLVAQQSQEQEQTSTRQDKPLEFGD